MTLQQRQISVNRLFTTFYMFHKIYCFQFYIIRRNLCVCERYLYSILVEMAIFKQ